MFAPIVGDSHGRRPIQSPRKYLLWNSWLVSAPEVLKGAWNSMSTFSSGNCVGAFGVEALCGTAEVLWAGEVTQRTNQNMVVTATAALTFIGPHPCLSLANMHDLLPNLATSVDALCVGSPR